jgi:hypothetical protein
MQDTSVEKDLFWTHNIGVLFDTKRLVEFVPTYDMSQEEKLNALTRLFVYTGVLLLTYTRRMWTLYIPILGMFFVIFLYRMSRQERGEISTAPPKDPTKGLKDDTKIIRPPYCTPPTRNNPFMNVLMNEWADNPTRPGACEYPEVSQETEDHFNYDLYKDIDDLYEKNNGQRQFFTMPYTTIPNDQGSFARWLYSVPETCKENQESCLRYEDLRSNRPTFGDSEYLT